MLLKHQFYCYNLIRQLAFLNHKLDTHYYREIINYIWVMSVLITF